MIRVQFDHQIFRIQEAGGISRYFVELARAFIENPEIGIEPVFNFKYTSNKHLYEAFPDMGFKLVKGFLGANLLKVLAFFPNRTAPQVDCIHYTFYLPRFTIKKSDTPTVTTLHDMIPELLGATPGFGNPHFSKVRYLRESTAVISVSKSSAEDFQKLVTQPRQDLRVIPHGTSLTHKISQSKITPERNFLFVGKRSGYKDGMLLIKALGRMQNPEVKVTFLGGGSLNNQEKKTIFDYGLESQVTHLNPTDDELAVLYANATALISTSRFEGFGLPVLEASLLKCPLILSKIRPYEELLGSSAFYFDVGSENQLAQQILSVLQNPTKAKKLASECQKIAQIHTWKKCAELTAQVYKDVLI